MDSKLTVHLWDEVGGQWGPTYIDALDENFERTNKEIHTLVERSIDHDPVDEEDKTKIKYAIWTSSLSLNIGQFGRGVIYVELWGTDAEAVTQMLEQWSPTSMRDALNQVTWAQAQVERSRRDNG